MVWGVGAAKTKAVDTNTTGYTFRESRLLLLLGLFNDDVKVVVKGLDGWV